MDILVTGEPGVGKTTVCERVWEALRWKGVPCGGVLSPAVEDGFVVMCAESGNICRFAVRGGHGDKVIGQFSFFDDGIDFANKALQNARDKEFIFIDEVGYLELNGGGLMPGVRSLLDTKSTLIVITRAWLNREVRDFFKGRRFRVFEVTEEERGELHNIILGLLIPGRV
jgi:nucleoside-triphosphatase THEP1